MLGFPLPVVYWKGSTTSSREVWAGKNQAGTVLKCLSSESIRCSQVDAPLEYYQGRIVARRGEFEDGEHINMRFVSEGDVILSEGVGLRPGGVFEKRATYIK